MDKKTSKNEEVIKDKEQCSCGKNCDCKDCKCEKCEECSECCCCCDCCDK